MKHSLQQIVLSSLLFVFAFFVVHDYVISSVDADTQYELCYAANDKSQLDLPSQIHDQIHILLNTLASEDDFNDRKMRECIRFSFEQHIVLTITPVLQRPPLA